MKVNTIQLNPTYNPAKTTSTISFKSDNQGKNAPIASTTTPVAVPIIIQDTPQFKQALKPVKNDSVFSKIIKGLKDFFSLKNESYYNGNIEDYLSYRYSLY
jgi:hypothetical protein